MTTKRNQRVIAAETVRVIFDALRVILDTKDVTM